MKAIVSVIGKDKKGIIAGVSGLLSDMDVNIEDISQTILQEYFTMIMAVELGQSKLSFTQISEQLTQLGAKIGVKSKMQSQQIFDAMHKIAMTDNN